MARRVKRLWGKGWHRRLAVVVVVLGTVALGVALSGTGLALRSSLAVTPAIKTDIINDDQACDNRLYAIPHSTNTTQQRTNVNNSTPYADSSWISAAGNPSSDNVTIPYPYGSTNVGLQFNKIFLLCDILVAPDAHSDRLLDFSAKITSSNFPNDKLPNPYDEIPDGYSVNTEYRMVKSISASAGTVSGYTPNTRTFLTRDSNSRYWVFAPMGFSYRAPTSIPATGMTVTFKVTYEEYHDFHPDRDSPMCVSGPGTVTAIYGVPTQPGTFGCTNGVAYLSFKILPGPAPPFTNTPHDAASPTTVITGVPTQVNYTANVQTVTTRPNVTYTIGVTPPAYGVAVGAIPSGSKTVTPGTHSYNYSYRVTVPVTVPNGTVICSSLNVTPHSDTDPTTASAPACFTVINPKIPVLNVAAGDAHAGCGTNGSSIATNTGSAGVEVVSASGTISGFSSTINSGRATLNGYVPNTTYPLCKPDLVNIARSYIAAGGSYQLLPTGTLDLGTLPGDGVYVVPGNVTISGTVAHNATLYVIGTLTVNGDVRIATPMAQRFGQPGLGVIVDGTINMLSTTRGVNEVDGYYFAGGSGANGTINTCTSVNCESVLQVNGLLMGVNVKLQRWGIPGVVQQTTAENVALNGQLFLNPPPLFNQDAVSYSNTNGRGEQSPRY